LAPHLPGISESGSIPGRYGEIKGQHTYWSALGDRYRVLFSPLVG
jgi:hypothetical protein